MEKYTQSCEDFGDIGQMIFNCIEFSEYGKEMLKLLRSFLSDVSFDEMMECFDWWREERKT
ncbi:unnamed protein product [marine sediment metagenome]|uniref:Uncharacterized protein n=1 Tax=marine sediment metagenome TaxID=412755 RepID=X1N6D5_9ZZZZ